MRILTIQDISELLKLSKSKCYELVSNGVLPSLKIEGSVRVLESDLIAYLESCRREGVERTQPRARPQLKHLRPS